MNQKLRIEVRLPEGHWSGDVSRQRPDTKLRIEETMPLAKGRGTAILSSDLDVEKDLHNHPGIEEVERLSATRYLVKIGAKGGGFIRPILDAAVIPDSPFEIRDGWVDWQIECSNKSRQLLIRLLRQDQIPFRIVSTRLSGNYLLTPRQRHVFEVGMKEGFWDVPRRTTLTDLSKQLGVSKSTLSAQIQRINSRVMHAFSEEIRKRSN